MDSAQFQSLVADAEALARRDPAALRRRVRLLVALGYGYVVGLLVLVLGTLAFLVTLSFTGRALAWTWKPIVALAVLAFALLRSLWVRVDAPTGEPLTRQQAPKLFQRVEAIRRSLKAPKPDVVLLTQDFNAAVTTIPRFGVLGGERTYLIVGLPLMAAMAPRHLDAVLAHEFGHLSGAHPKFGLWVHRVGRIWGQLLGRMESSNAIGDFIFGRFLRWYTPRLNAHGFALARDDEYAADADAARASGAKVAAQALASIAVRDQVYDRFWSDLGKRVTTEAAPPERSWTLLPEAFAAGDRIPERARWLATALKRENLIEDTHPSLRLRLGALKALREPMPDAEALLAELVPPVTSSAAEHYLGAFAQQRLQAWEQAWRRDSADGWARAHAELAKDRATADALVARDAAGETLTVAELWTAAEAILRLDGPDAGLPWLERAVAVDPAHAPSHYALGAILLDRRDGRGVPLVKRAMELDLEAVPAGTELLRRFHAAVGDRDALAREEVESDARFARLREVASERGGLTQEDTLVAATLSATDREQLAKAATVPGVGALWVARKVTKHLPEKPLIVVLVEPRSPLLSQFSGKRQQMAQQVYESLALDGGKELLVLAWDDSYSWIVKMVKGARGLRVTAKQGVLTATPDAWHKVHRRALVIAGIGAVMVGGLLWLFHVPERLSDPRGLITANDARGLNMTLFALRRESGVDIHVVVDSFAPGTDLAGFALNEARRRGVGRTSDRRGLLLVIDRTSGGLRLEVGPNLEGIFPDGFVGRILRGHTAGILREDTFARSVNSTIMMISHRVREAALDMEYDPLSVSDITDSTRLAAGAGATFSYGAGEPLRLDRAPDPEIAALLSAGATPEETLERYQQWLSLPVYVPRAAFLTPGSRAFFQHEFKMTPAYWEFLRYFAAGSPMQVETRGDLAVAYATGSPLITPLYFRRGEQGWEMDVMAELLNSQNVVGGPFSWCLSRRGGDHDRALADTYVVIDGCTRFRYGDNRRLAWRRP